jgi:hypothetical protein
MAAPFAKLNFLHLSVGAAGAAARPGHGAGPMDYLAQLQIGARNLIDYSDDLSSRDYQALQAGPTTAL